MKRILSFAMAAILPLFAACTTDDADVTLSVSPSVVEFPAEGATVSVVITTDADSFTYTGQAEWLTVTVDGKSLSLKAEANTELESRSCDITVSAGRVSQIIAVTQAAADKYEGYTEVSLSNDPDVPGAYYMGTMLQMFDPTIEGTGGMAGFTFTLNSMEELSIAFFTEGFASKDLVYLPEGTYTLGKDFTDGNGFVADPMTFVGGVSVVTEDEEIQQGSYIANSTTGALTNITGGSFTITENEDGTYLIKMDFVDEKGNACKYYYEGQVLFDTSMSFYPTPEEVDPTKDILAIAGTYRGAVEGHADLCSIQLGMTAGSGIVPMTVIDFNSAYKDFSADMDLSGTYNAVDYGSAVGINKYDVETQLGTYIFLDMTFNMFYADGESTMTLAKNTDGTYNVDITLRSTASEDVYTYDLDNIVILIEDGTAVSDEEYID